MPRLPLHVLTWSAEQDYYKLTTGEQTMQHFHPADDAAWQSWLGSVSSFTFHGRCGDLNVYQENRSRGGAYWYAYHTVGRRTHKRYLGRTARVTTARLEEEARILRAGVEAGARPSPVPPAQAPIAPPLPSEVLLSTKLSVPRLPPGLVERPRLLRDLNTVSLYRLTLISASAGSGKTTLLAAWDADCARRADEGEEASLAWLSLDALDNEPPRFWASVIAALRTCLPTIGREALELLHSQDSPPLSAILALLLNELVKVDRDMVLILDDYHVIEDLAIHESLIFLLDHLPDTLHLVLSTRTDPELPLSRLRVRSQMVEIREGDLRFTEQETASFLLQRMGLSLSEETVAILQQRTEGWVAGLQLAALSLHKRDDLNTFIQDFTGSHRFVLDYVQQDILARLPLPLQHFLLQTSILTRMNAALCQAVTSGSGELASQKMLEELERANLFVVPLDAKQQWYRYHDLFREALRTRLHVSQPELVPGLHQRAARWYEAQGEMREAIVHAIAASDYPYVALLLEREARRFWLRGEAQIVHNWLQELPDAILWKHARLTLNTELRLLNVAHESTEAVYARTQAQVERTLTRMEAGLHRKPESGITEAEAALIERRMRLLRALIELKVLVKHDDIEHQQLLAQETEKLPQDEEVIWNMISHSISFWVIISAEGDGASLLPRLREIKQQATQEGDFLATVRVMLWLAMASIQAGQLRQAEQECRQALTLIKQSNGHTHIEGYLHHTLFNVYYAWNKLEEAAEEVSCLRHIAQQWQQMDLPIIEQVYSAQIALARGDLSGADEALQKGEALIQQEKYTYYAPWVSTLRIQWWLAQKNYSLASQWAAQAAFATDAWNPSRKSEFLVWVRVLLALRQYSEAVQMLQHFKEHLDHPGRRFLAIEFLGLYVVALHQSGEKEQAAHAAVRLLALTEPEGYIRVYLDAGPVLKQVLQTLLSTAPREGADATTVGAFSRSYVSRLLAIFDQEERRMPRPVPSIDAPSDHQQKRLSYAPQAEENALLMEPLSLQERKVLHLLVAGRTYAEIAETLVVSLNTVKTQVGSIYRKLGVSRRAEAISVVTRAQLL
ncbi:LuxR family transcriptional regulator [Ktedonosporobacter rubrisoli]|uniref:LuxR family transcriptional regulator n=1 Tax=Ktedonosporobacter rubrisoli TaxID=2509675 RepID=A0A4P6K3P1_KTERU|nr:LuxR C-terminal-related transcriptional regulator [Ktedonosporobacter rubrisoli]QBD82888.1 LuxR family transcriptional regulator [Ktedonosporobacter rubrisoli]